MRPIPRPCNDNSRRFVSRRHFLYGMAVAGCTAALSAQQRPQRIVSTAPSSTEALFALGLGDRVVGVSRYCKYPASVQNLPKVGTFLYPDAEAIARLAPDLVVLQQTSSDLTGRLNALHIPFIEVPHETLDDVYTEIGLIAKAGGVPERAVALNARIQGELAAVQSKAKQFPPTRVLVVVDRRPGMLADLTAVGPDNYIQQLLEIAGGENVLARPSLPAYPRISLETILREDPGTILDMSGHSGSEAERQAASAQVVKLWAQQPQLTAVRKGRVVVGISDALVVPGPRAPQAAAILFGLLHGGAGDSKGRAS